PATRSAAQIVVLTGIRLNSAPPPGGAEFFMSAPAGPPPATSAVSKRRGVGGRSTLTPTCVVLRRPLGRTGTSGSRRAGRPSPLRTPGDLLPVCFYCLVSAGMIFPAL